MEPIRSKLLNLAACAILLFAAVAPSGAQQIAPNPNNGIIDTPLDPAMPPVPNPPAVTASNGVGVTFTNNGTVNLWGSFDNNGTINNDGRMTDILQCINHNNNAGAAWNNNAGAHMDIGNGLLNNAAGATFNNYGDFNTGSLGGSIINHGTITNHASGYYFNGVQTRNYGTFVNNGTYEGWIFRNYAGTVTNNGAWIHHSGIIDNAAGAVFDNNGTMTTASWYGSTFGIYNGGTFNNNAGAVIANGAGITSFNLAGGAFNNAGTLANNGTLNNLAGAQFANTGILNNPGILNNSGTLANSGTLDNSGWLASSGNLANTGRILNSGTLDNSGSFENSAALDNTGNLNNQSGARLNNPGLLNIPGGATLNNSGSLASTGTLNNGGKVTNTGNMASDGTLNNINGATIANFGAMVFNGVVNNSGTVTNSGTLVSNGTFNNNFGALLLSDGTLTSNGMLTSNGLIKNTGLFTNNGLLNGTGSIAGDLVNNGTISQGLSFIQFGRRVQDARTMGITGSYTHHPTAVYEVEINPGGLSDKLLVSGSAYLNGGRVAVLAEEGIYNMRTSYNILTAASVVGTFGEVTSNLAFLTPTLSYDPQNVFLLLTRNSTRFVDVALTENEQAVATALDTISPLGPTGDMEKVFNALLALSAEGARSAYDQTGGLIHTTAAEVSFSSFNRHLNTMNSRMDGYANGTPSSNFALRPVTLAARDSLTDAGNTILAALAGAELDNSAPWGFWMQGYGGLGDRQGQDISSRYRYDSSGIAIGFDRNLADLILAGASLGYSYGSVRMKDLSENAAIASLQAALYGIYSTDPGYLRAILSYGFNHYETKRDISFGDIARTANADYDSYTLGGYLESGFKLKTPYVDIIPMGSITLNKIFRDSFNETGAGSLNLNAQSESSTFFLGSLGVRLTRQYASAAGTFTPEFRARWDHRISGDRFRLNASFEGYPQAVFTTKGDMPERDSLGLGAGISWQLKKNLDLNLLYNGSLAGDNSEHAAALALKLIW